MRLRHLFPAAVLILLVSGCHTGIQRADLSFEPTIPAPAWPDGGGPVVAIDEAHANFHTVEGRYAPFAGLLRRDGYDVRRLAAPASADSLAGVDVYVIANAIAESDQRVWKLPIEPAFGADEIAAIQSWVESGGALFLIADHMPFPGSVEDLAAAFDVFFANGYLYDADDSSKLEYRRDTGLADHPITAGRNDSERVDAVRVFTGQAFRATRKVDALLTVPRGSRLLLPTRAWKFTDKTPSIPADGLFQGAVFPHGSGRVAVFGEAAMFSAQERIVGRERELMGMNRSDAEQNPQFVLNLMHWLSGLLD